MSSDTHDSNMVDSVEEDQGLGDVDYETLRIQLWVAFGAGAGRFIEPECVDVAQQKGYTTNVSTRLDAFRFGKVLERTLQCCFQAGQVAALIALRRGCGTITPDIYREAVDYVYTEQQSRIEASEELQAMLSSGRYGGVC